MRRREILIALAAVATISMSLPAAGAPSPVGLVKNALKTAKSAKRDARKALVEARKPAELATARVQATKSLLPHDSTSLEVPCPTGYLVASGGYTAPLTRVSVSNPIGEGWAIVAVNVSDTATTSVRVIALCVKKRAKKKLSTAAARISRADLKRALAKERSAAR
jgi:hypothetical protein